jgi:tetratricopeptide (TPR) repeat protein
MQPFETLSPSQKRNLRWLVEALQNFGNALFHTKDGESISILEEAAAIALSLKDDPALASINLNLGNAYLSVVEPPDFTNAEMYFRRSLAKRPEPDVLGRGRCATALGGLYFSRWLEQPWPDLDQDGADQALLQKFMDDATADLRQSDAYFELAIELLPAIPSGDLCACYYNSAQVKIKLHVMGLWRNRQSSYIESAMERFTIAGRMAGDLGNRLQAAQFRLQTAKMALQTGRISLAREFAKAALVTYQSLEEDSTREQLETYKLLVEIAHSEKSSS